MVKFISIIMGLVFASLTSIPLIPHGDTEARYSSDFQGGTLRGTQERTIRYTTREIDQYKSPYGAPVFRSYKEGACSVNAGGNAMIYYDRLYDDLVPDYKHTYIFGSFDYGRQTNAVNNMFDDLYTRMGTTVDGTTVSGFLSGMRSYASSRGRYIAFEKVTGGYHNTNIAYLKEQLKKEKVAVVFVDGFSISSNNSPIRRDGYDYVLHNIYEGLHTMLVYGYADYYYYGSSGNLESRDTYLYVSTGYATSSLGLLNISVLCTVDDIYLINIS